VGSVVGAADGREADLEEPRLSIVTAAEKGGGDADSVTRLPSVVRLGSFRRPQRN